MQMGTQIDGQIDKKYDFSEFSFCLSLRLLIFSINLGLFVPTKILFKCQNKPLLTYEEKHYHPFSTQPLIRIYVCKYIQNMYMFFLSTCLMPIYSSPIHKCLLYININILRDSQREREKEREGKRAERAVTSGHYFHRERER